MPLTYDSLATTTVSGSSTNTITFSSISSGYTDLRLVLAGTTTAASTSVRVRVNGDTNNNYSLTSITGNGSTASSTSAQFEVWMNLSYTTASWPSTQPALATLDFMSYSGSTNKSVLANYSQDLNGSGVTESVIFLWRNTAAINSISVFTNANNFSAGFTASLYGILRA